MAHQCIGVCYLRYLLTLCVVVLHFSSVSNTSDDKVTTGDSGTAMHYYINI